MEFRWKKNKLYSEQWDKYLTELESEEGADPNSEIERNLGALICQDIQNSENDKDDAKEETGLSINEMWEDEYKLLRGGGLQWSTNMAYRSYRDRQKRPNSEDNFIHSAIEIQTANLTANPIEPSMRGRDGAEDKAQTLTHMARYNDYRNKFQSVWVDIVRDYVAYGPAIVKVCWDGEWIGGRGPDRFIGDVKIERIKKEDFVIDPVIMDIEKDLQKSKFAGFKSRQSLRYLGERWPKYAKHIGAEVNDDDLVDEGTEGETATLYEMYYRGFPEFVSDERAKELRERAMIQEEQGDYYKSQDLLDMAKGELEGVHLAYYCDDILLEYVPYVYDHGKYPVAFTSRYKDLYNQWGYGEIRNVKIPQLLHNKADEIEIEAMAKEGLGGGHFEVGAIDDRQLDNIIENNARSGMWFPVNRIEGIKERTGVKTPASITNYKEHKQRMVETVSSNTPIQQGMSPSANMPYKAIAELGNRTDVRTKAGGDKLKNLLIAVNKLRVELFGQYYTEERYYRYVDSQDKVHEGTFSNQEIFDVWSREVAEEPISDEQGNPMTDPMTGQPMTRQVERQEFFIPEFDIDVQVISKRPNDREYHTSMAFQLAQMGILGPEHLLYTLEEGRLPDREEILEEMQMRNQVQGLMAQLEEMPREVKDMVMQSVGQIMQGAMAGVQQVEAMTGGKGNGMQKG